MKLKLQKDADGWRKACESIKPAWDGAKAGASLSSAAILLPVLKKLLQHRDLGALVYEAQGHERVALFAVILASITLLGEDEGNALASSWEKSKNHVLPGAAAGAAAVPLIGYLVRSLD